MLKYPVSQLSETQTLKSQVVDHTGNEIGKTSAPNYFIWQIIRSINVRFPHKNVGGLSNFNQVFFFLLHLQHCFLVLFSFTDSSPLPQRVCRNNVLRVPGGNPYTATLRKRCPNPEGIGVNSSADDDGDIIAVSSPTVSR